MKEISNLLDQYLQHGDISTLARLYLPKSCRYPVQYASKVKRGKVRNPALLKAMIDKAIENKHMWNFEQSIRRLQEA